MSCIAGELRIDGSEADRHLVEPMLAPMRQRAPDGADLVCAGPVALSQAFLRTGSSGAESPHRLTFEGEVWIVADARIDGRHELVTKLRAAGHIARVDDPHGELILHAWHAFGDKLLDHLIGDFAFAIWDSRVGRLFCARDHFGVRPFYYVQSASRLLFASDIAALLVDPSVSREIDQDAAADFQLLGVLTRPEQTIYRQVRCLPPGTRMVATPDSIRVQSWWTLKPQPPVRFRSRHDYADCFRDLLRHAVTDRLPAGPVAVQLSGGMDSTAIAACAAISPRPGVRVTGYHVTTRSVEPRDDEEAFARLAAERLGIPMASQDIGAYRPFMQREDPQLRTSFPLAYPLLAAHRDNLAAIAQTGARVMLSGYGGDAVLSPNPAFYADLLRARRWRQFAGEAADHLRATGSFRGMGLRSLLRARRSPAWKPEMPDWFEPGYAQANDLPARWRTWWAQHESAEGQFAQLGMPGLHRQFEADEALRLPVVCRYPFQDIRLVKFLLGVPNFMLQDKAILREAMRELLPDEVLDRPKTGAPGDLVRSVVTGGKFTLGALGDLAVPGLARDKFASAWEQYCAGAGSDSTWASWLIFQPLALGVWLSQQEMGE